MINKQDLIKEQIKLSEKVITHDNFEKLKFIASCELFSINDKIIAVIAVVDYNTMELIEYKFAEDIPKLKYISGLQAYREMPAITKAFALLKQKPDLLICLGNGILHPRRFGIASHLGIVLDIPVIGVARKLLMGDLRDDRVYVDKEARAVMFTTKKHAKPIFVSPGHKISLKSSIEIIKHCMKGHKFPEPLHIAHRVAVKIKHQIK